LQLNYFQFHNEDYAFFTYLQVEVRHFSLHKHFCRFEWYFTKCIWCLQKSGQGNYFNVS